MKIILIFSISLFIYSCNPTYIIYSAYEGSKVLLKREKITSILKEENQDPELKRKLKLVLNAREYSKKIGLKPGKSFTRYSKIEKDVLNWVLVAAKKDSFELKTWWFPIVGKVPYKGFFNRKDALNAAEKYKEKGYETWVRGAEAISTLGWFIDPVLSTTLKNKDTRIVNTVLHETVHTTIWIPNHVDFNESLANYVGHKATIDYYRASLTQCLDLECKEREQEKLNQSTQSLEQEIDAATVITLLHNELSTLYESNLEYEKKLEQREIIFNKTTKDFRNKYPKINILKEIHNAEIMQLKLYLSEFSSFDQLHKQCESNWECFFSKIEAIKEKAKDENPFEQLKKSST